PYFRLLLFRLFGAPALHERGADERNHRFAVLIHPAVAHRDHAPTRTTVRAPHFDDLAAIRHGVADIDRLEPLQIAEAGRRAELGDRFAARAARVVLAAAPIGQQPHPHAGGPAPPGAQPAEMRARGRGLVEMERLRIEARRKRLDFFGGKDVTAEFVDLTDANVFEELHGRLCTCCSAPAGAASRPNIECTIKIISVRSEPVMSSKRNLTKPSLGRLRETRVSSTTARALMRSPGRSGASHLTSSTPGAPMKLVSASRLSLSMRISTQQVCQPEAIRPP